MAHAPLDPEHHPDDDLLAKTELADLPRVTPSGVVRRISDGHLPVPAPASGRPAPRVRRADLDLLVRPEAVDRMADEEISIPPPRPRAHDPSAVNHDPIAKINVSPKRPTEQEKAERRASSKGTRRHQEGPLERQGGRPPPRRLAARPPGRPSAHPPILPRAVTNIEDRATAVDAIVAVQWTVREQVSDRSLALLTASIRDDRP